MNYPPYQQKTTVVTILVGVWTEKTDRDLSSLLNAAHAVALKIASCCQMDIMSITSFPLEKEEDSYRMTVIYNNNGRTHDAIREIMKPEIDNKPPHYWMIQDIYEWQGLLECVVSIRGTDEEWD